MSEIKFKRWFRNEWFGWSESYEPARGGGVGIPDVQLLVNYFGHGKEDVLIREEATLLPLELKIGKIEKGLLKPHDVRADQIGWHWRFNKAGGTSAFIIGVPVKKSWAVFGVLGNDRDLLMRHKSGWEISELMIGMKFGEGIKEKHFS